MKNPKYLQNKQIAISISESEEINQLGYSDRHQTDAMTEFARHFLVQGAMLVYGGDLRDKGYTELFADLAEQYYSDKNQKFVFKNYFFYPLNLNVTKAHEGDFKDKNVAVIRVEPEESLNITEKEFVKPDTPANKYLWAKCITKMREEMNITIDARIVLGGRNTGFLGKCPGIVEEAKIAILSKKPTYLIGAFGGATLSMINAIVHRKNVINPQSAFYQTNDFIAFQGFYNATSQTDKIDFDEINAFFNQLNISDLNNGLSETENKRLFTTPHIPEAIFWVLKGLKNTIK
jgi:SLOG cluster2